MKRSNVWQVDENSTYIKYNVLNNVSGLDASLDSLLRCNYNDVMHQSGCDFRV